MEEKREIWSIMIGRTEWSAETYKVYGTKDEVDVVAYALIGYIHYHDGACACVAKRGEYVSFRDFDEAYCDCM